MNPGARNKLRVGVVAAAEGVLARQGFVSAIDVLLGMGWLDQATLKRSCCRRLPRPPHA